MQGSRHIAQGRRAVAAAQAVHVGAVTVAGQRRGPAVHLVVAWRVIYDIMYRATYGVQHRPSVELVCIQCPYVATALRMRSSCFESDACEGLGVSPDAAATSHLKSGQASDNQYQRAAKSERRETLAGLRQDWQSALPPRCQLLLEVVKELLRHLICPSDDSVL